MCGNICNFEKTDPWTAIIWYRGTARTTSQYLLSNLMTGVRGWAVYIDVDGNVCVRLAATSGGGRQITVRSATTVVTDDAWHMITVMYTGGLRAANVTTYVDTTLQTNDSLADTLYLGTESMVSTSPFRVGYNAVVFSLYLARRACEVSVYNRVLTSTEIGVLYNGKRPVDPRKQSTNRALLCAFRIGTNDLYPIGTALVGTQTASMNGCEEADIVTDAPAG